MNNKENGFFLCANIETFFCENYPPNIEVDYEMGFIVCTFSA